MDVFFLNKARATNLSGRHAAIFHSSTFPTRNCWNLSRAAAARSFSICSPWRAHWNYLLCVWQRSSNAETLELHIIEARLQTHYIKHVNPAGLWDTYTQPQPTVYAGACIP